MKVIFALSLFLISLCFGKESFQDRIDLSGSPKAGYLEIPRDQSINASTFLYVKYALESFRNEEVRFVLLHLNTPGGEVFSALRISEELKKMESEYQIPVIAFIDNWALSAGALLAYSCPFIGAVSDASMGAAEPVVMGSDGQMETASEKMVSALRTEFAKTASLYGRDPLVAEAMVDKDVCIVLRDGKIVKLLENSQILETDTVINAKGKLLTLDAFQLKELSIANFVVSKKLTDDPFFQDKEIEYVTYHNWKIGVFAFLSNPLVSSLLMIGLMAGFYGAIQSGGFSVSTGIGALCLALILISSFGAEVIGYLEVLILGLGLFLFVVDLFLLGGFGFLGGLGFLLFIFATVAILLPPLQGFSWNPGEWGVHMSEWFYRLTLFLFSLLLFFFCVLPLSSFFFRKSPSFKKLVLKESDEALEEEKKLPSPGEEGICFSALRPFGKVEIEGIVYEAQTEGEFIPPTIKVLVIGIKGSVLIVRER